MSVSELKAEIEKWWLDEPPARLCVKILDFIAALPAGEHQMLTFQTFARCTGKNSVDSDVMTAVSILVSSSISALDPKALLVDDDDNEYEIEPEQLAEARTTGELIHPETGIPVAEFESKLFPFFVPSARFYAEPE